MSKWEVVVGWIIDGGEESEDGGASEGGGAAEWQGWR